MSLSADNDAGDQAVTMEHLQHTNKVLAGKLFDLSETHGSLMRGLMLCQDLLAQFMRPEIRHALLDGKFAIHTNNQPVLQSMDIFSRRMLLCPGSPGQLLTNFYNISIV